MNLNKNILLAGPYPPPFGGIASHLVTLIPGLREKGFKEIAVVKFETTDSHKVIDCGDLYTFRVSGHLTKLLNPVYWKFIITALNVLPVTKLGIRNVLREAIKAMLIGDIIKKHNIDILSFYQVDHSLALLICSKIWKEKKIVLTVFGEVYDEKDFFSKSESLIKKMLTVPDALVSSSCHCARGYNMYEPRYKIEPVYYGVDLERFNQPDLKEKYRKEIGVAEDDILLLFMGRFSEHMGLDRLVEIMPEVFRSNNKIKILIAGAKGPLSDMVAEFKRQYTENVIVMNDVPFLLQPSIYASADIVLAPSRDQHACMGMSIKEAMASSKPVIGSRAGGVPEAIVHGETGFLVPLDSSQNVSKEEMKNCILELTANRNLRETMSFAARKRAEEMFSMQKTIDRMADIFTSTVRTK